MSFVAAQVTIVAKINKQSAMRLNNFLTEPQVKIIKKLNLN